MKLNKPYISIWITALLILIIDWKIFNVESNALDIATDTYFIEHNNELIWTAVVVFIVIGIIYFIFDLLNLKLNEILINLHVIISILGTLFYLFIPNFWYFKMEMGFVNKDIISIVGLFLIVAQVLFLINLVVGIYKKNNKPVANNQYN